MSRRDLRHELQQADLAMRDGAYVATVVTALGRLMKLYFRSDVRGMAALPAEGGALIVSNLSGGLLPMDVPIIAGAFVEQFGPTRPLYVAAPDLLFRGVGGPVLRRCGFMPGGNTSAILDAGGVTIVFPGGDHDRFRPSSAANTIDFAGSTEYVDTALRSGVPVVPVVSIGGQEAQLHLWRGERTARLLRRGSGFRGSYVPVSFGIPFGLSAMLPLNLPLPTKITTQVLDPIDLAAEFGDDPDVAVVDAEIRARMQRCLDELARSRRFPVLG
ncbi:MAG: 1-acyl-sn-glycerol-3-phosphate acyltransferase [Nocardioides sp.]